MSERHVANVGLDYRSSKDGRHIRVEAGEEVLELAGNSLLEEVRAGNITVIVDERHVGKSKKERK